VEPLGQGKRRRLRGGLAAALAAAAVGSALLAPGADSRAARLPHAFFGINPGVAVTARDAQLMARAGIRDARFQVNWGLVQPTRDSPYRWTASDAGVAELAARGIRALPMLTGTPSWVAKTPIKPPTALPLGRRLWPPFVRAAVERYGPGGGFWKQHPDLPYLPIRSWEVWNEPNLPFFFKSRSPVRDYLRLLRVSSRAIRSVGPRERVVLAGLGPGLLAGQVPAPKFLAALYRHGAKRTFDIVADHPYAAAVKGRNGVARQLERLRKVMRAHHDRAAIWVNELGWSSGRIKGNGLEVGSAGRQARLLARSFHFIVGHAHRLGITKLMWYDWRDPPRSHPDCRGCLDFGLRRNDERPKPALRAFLRFAR
jgi:hypothetical protein